MTNVIAAILMGTGFSLTPNYNEVKPIFKNRCSQCHQYMPTKNWEIYDDAYNARNKIKLRLVNKTMPPPGLPLTADEKAAILNWIKNGAKK